MSARDRIDPELVANLDAFHALVGPKGLPSITDLAERRAVEAKLAKQIQDSQPQNPNITFSERQIPGPPGDPEITVRIYQPKDRVGTAPGVYFIHGGGMIHGSLETSHTGIVALTEAQQCVTVSVDYRLAPEHPDPAPVEDCYAGLTWFFDHAEELDVDASRIAIVGGSAGGGLAAGCTLLARDRRGPQVAFQMLIYPMLDDRLETPSSHEIVDLGAWDRDASIEGWTALLGDRHGTDQVSPYAAPARMRDLSNLPPTYIDTGGLDGFRDEDFDYAQRLAQAGVDVEFHHYPGAYHASEILNPNSGLARRLMGWRMDALRRALATEDG